MSSTLAGPDCLLLAGRFSLLDRSAAAEVMPECLADGPGVVIGGVFNSGTLPTAAVPGAQHDFAGAKGLGQRYRPVGTENPALWNLRTQQQGRNPFRA